MKVRVRDDETLVDVLAEAIHSEILIGDLQAGSRLRQETLAAEFGVSRTPVREALRKLEAGGMIDMVPRRGAVVRGPRGVDLREAYVIRAALEGLAAELAAARIGAEQLDRLREAERLFSQAAPDLIANGPRLPRDVASSTGGLWETANDLFHEAILEAADASRLSVMIADLHRAVPRHLTWAPLAEEPSLLGDNILQHSRIRAALERRSGEEARRWMTDHILRSGDLVVAWFERHRRDSESVAPGE